MNSSRPTLYRGSAWVMETRPRKLTIAARLQGSQNGSREVAWGRYYIPFRGEDLSARSFVNILVNVTPTAATGRLLTPLSCACSGTPLALFSPVVLPPDSQAERGRGEGALRSAQHPCFFIRRCCGLCVEYSI